jgi:DNA (cytosine-5)-methyltransferase 1
VKEIRPAGFVFENVASLRHPTNQPVLERVIEQLGVAGYRIETQILHAEQYGVPQTRSRLFIVGLRSRRASPNLPSPTNWWLTTPPTLRKKLLPPETAGRWISDLRDTATMEERIDSAARWAEHLKEIPPGWNYKHFTEWAGHDRPIFVTETRYWNFLLKLTPYRPAWTIQASPGPWTGPFHWESRELSPMERAALQTFPRSYAFVGDRRSRIRQIGNAVPPVLASQVISSLLAQILGSPPTSGRKLRYRLANGFEFRATALRKGRGW